MVLICKQLVLAHLAVPVFFIKAQNISEIEKRRELTCWTFNRQSSAILTAAKWQPLRRSKV